MTKIFAIAAGALITAGCAQTPSIKRVGLESAPISSSVSVSSARSLVFVSGTVPDPLVSGSAESFGDTEQQTRSVLKKITEELRVHGLGPENVVMMRIYLVAPPGSSKMDFQGMMRAYREVFGTSSQPNKPARTTVQVAGLLNRGWLVEIEVTASRCLPPCR